MFFAVGAGDTTVLQVLVQASSLPRSWRRKSLRGRQRSVTSSLKRAFWFHQRCLLLAGRSKLKGESIRCTRFLIIV